LEVPDQYYTIKLYITQACLGDDHAWVIDDHDHHFDYKPKNK
jgi:hypothetical protein